MKTIKIDNIEVIKEPFEKLTLEEATVFAENIGEGFRLPNKLELMSFFKAKKKLNSELHRFYWSSEGRFKSD